MITGDPAYRLGNSRQRIDARLQRAAAAGKLAGVVAMAATGRDILYEGAFGRRDVSQPVAITVDSVFMIASMTKVVTAGAALQLVEQGKLPLDEPLGRLVPELADPMVLEGFTADFLPILRPARRPLTLIHLLTHTSGFSHEIWSAEIARYQAATGTPVLGTNTNASLCLPLLFDPGDAWAYGIGVDWVGKVVEAASGQTLGSYFRDRVTGPLGMSDTTFGSAPRHRGRVVPPHQREADGSLTVRESGEGAPSEYEAGGGGLYSTAGDYLAFLRMLLNSGRHGSVQILRPETVRLMRRNHIGDLLVGTMKSVVPGISNDFELFPGMEKKWSLNGLSTPNRDRTGGARAASRGAGSPTPTSGLIP